jgi:S-DNA-T family DNA segregation ATPase FtsK/SpoIIIE
MSAPSPDTPRRGRRQRLPAEKGRELRSLVLALLGLLIGFSLATYHPGDPSLMRQASEAGARARNWIGPIGANVAAIGFGLLGYSAFLVPLLLLTTAWRRLRASARPRIVGRGLGAVIVLVTLPGLLQLTLERAAWRGEQMDAGGGLGRLLADSLSRNLGFAGALLLLIGLVVIGGTLLVQSTLGEMLARWRQRLLDAFQGLRLVWARRRERRDKERSRRRVVRKHLRRVVEQRESSGDGQPAAGTAMVDPPLRVERKSGDKGFGVRRVAAPTAASSGGGKKQRSAATTPQQKIPFEEPSRKADLPPLNLLNLEPVRTFVEENELVRRGELIRSRCAEFGVEGTIEGISPGPVVTVFEFQPAPGVKVSQIVGLQDDLALALKAEAVRIDRLPGRSTLGIEVPNVQRAMIHLGHLLEREAFRNAPSKLTMAIGMDLHGEPFYADLGTMPHLLVAGATGSGKSVGLQSMITSLMYKATRDEVQFIFIDPKRIELGAYADIPHLKTEVVVEPKKAANALRWAVAELERRYRLLAEVHVRSIDYYNRAIQDPEVRERLSLSEGELEVRDEDLKPLPYYIIVIDELADLMMIAASEVETSIARLAQMARAVGIHLIVATQRPSTDVLTGTIKANFPCRIAYATASQYDSRTILDQKGAESLLGKGDMLFMAPGTSRTMRLHGAYVSEQETAALVRWLKKQGKPNLDLSVLEAPEEDRSSGAVGDQEDELYDEAVRTVVAEGQGSASFLQRRMRIGFSRAARLIDMMERDGILGPPQGSKPRDVLVKSDYFEEIDRAKA